MSAVNKNLDLGLGAVGQRPFRSEISEIQIGRGCLHHIKLGRSIIYDSNDFDAWLDSLILALQTNHGGRQTW